MNNERIETLIEEAFAARKMAYTPYSGGGGSAD